MQRAESRDGIDLARHAHYVHINPLTHGLAERVADWRWSTFRRYVRPGILPPIGRQRRLWAAWE